MIGSYIDDRRAKLEAGTQEVSDLVGPYANSPITRKLERCLDVLGQLGAGKPDEQRPWKTTSIDIALQLIDDGTT